MRITLIISIDIPLQAASTVTVNKNESLGVWQVGGDDVEVTV